MMMWVSALVEFSAPGTLHGLADGWSRSHLSPSESLVGGAGAAWTLAAMLASDDSSDDSMACSMPHTS
jgi:hypothetical protein